jgi:hypothetical protein
MPENYLKIFTDPAAGTGSGFLFPAVNFLLTFWSRRSSAGIITPGLLIADNSSAGTSFPGTWVPAGFSGPHEGFLSASMLFLRAEYSSIEESSPASFACIAPVFTALQDFQE